MVVSKSLKYLSLQSSLYFNCPAYLAVISSIKIWYANGFQFIYINCLVLYFSQIPKHIFALHNTDYRKFISENPQISDKTVYTGQIDEFFDYQLGVLEYRSVRFETEVLDKPNYQGNAVVNYTDKEVPYTRIIEHKHFEFGKQPKTVISREYSSEWKKGDEPYYPVNNEKNTKLYEQYVKLAKSRPDVIFGGRLGAYKYFDMDKVIDAALSKVLNESL